MGNFDIERPTDAQLRAVCTHVNMLKRTYRIADSSVKSHREWAGAATFVEAGNRLGYVNYTPNPLEVDDYIRSYAGRLGPICRWFRDYPRSIATTDPTLAQLDLPVQLFWGRHDALLNVENATRLQQRLQRVRLEVLENAGHFSYQDDAKTFADLVIRWVEHDHRTL
jgi:pimeloyl-ACP methyl ester carboxylesterase